MTFFQLVPPAPPTSSKYFKVIQGDLRCSNVASPQLGFYTINVGKF